MLLRNGFRAYHKPKTIRRAAPFRAALEALEDRVVPTGFALFCLLRVSS
jgi:hypothetical protein